MIDIRHRNPSVLDDRLERRPGAVQQILSDLLELRAGQRLVEEQRILIGVDGDVRQVDRRGLTRAQLDLGLLGGFTKPLHGHLVLGQVDTGRGLELVDEPFDDPVVPVVAAEVVVTGGGADLDDPVADLQQRDVKGAAAEVEDQDGLFLIALVHAVGEGRGSGFVDDAQDVKARDLAGFLGRLALGVIEVRRHRDDRVGDVLAEVAFRITLQFLQRTRADLLGGVVLAVDLDGPVGAHMALDRPDRAVDVGHRLVLGGLADQHLAVTCKGHHRRGRAGSLGVGDDDRVATLENRDDRVGGPEVDSDRTSHVVFLLLGNSLIRISLITAADLSELDSSLLEAASAVNQQLSVIDSSCQ